MSAEDTRAVHAVMSVRLRVLMLFVWACALVGCGTAGHTLDPTTVMLDRERSVDRRLAAARQQTQTDPDNPDRLAALNRLIMSPKQPDALRLYAVDELVRLDAQRFRSTVAAQLTSMTNWTSMRRVMDVFVEQGWTDLTPLVVQNYAREAFRFRDSERPERDVLQRLRPDSELADTIKSVCVNEDGATTYPQQVAAWELLCRLEPTDELRAWMLALPPKTNLIGDLQAAWKQLHVMPTNRQEVLWLVFLRDPANGAAWRDMARITQHLSDEQKQGLELRHLTLLRLVDENALPATTAQAAAEVRKLLSSETATTIDSGSKGPSGDRPQTFGEVVEELSWGDLVTIAAAYRASRQPRVRDMAFREAQLDFEDGTTEFGGMLDRNDDGWYMLPHPPLMKRNDTTYFAPPDLLLRLYTSGLHYHLHAQLRENAVYAGPGRGDMNFARRMRLSGVIFTTIEKHRINVDYYQPNGAVVDLGHITR